MRNFINNFWYTLYLGIANIFIAFIFNIFPEGSLASTIAFNLSVGVFIVLVIKIILSLILKPKQK